MSCKYSRYNSIKGLKIDILLPLTALVVGNSLARFILLIQNVDKNENCLFYFILGVLKPGVNMILKSFILNKRLPKLSLKVRISI